MSVPILEVENLTVILRQKKKKKVLVDNLNFKLYEGQCLGILGESGSGKSTLGRVICGMLKPDSGIYTLNNVEIYKSKSKKKYYKKS